MAGDDHRAALLDWMACAVGGAQEPAALAARAAAGYGGTRDEAAAAGNAHAGAAAAGNAHAGAAAGGDARIVALGTAGHVLDFDDTYLPGLAHLSAPVAPAAIVLAAERGARVGDLLAAFAAGFEAMGALARGAHPALYERGWHPTAVCGGVGAAVAAAHLLGLDDAARRSAIGLALLRSGGLRSGFGSDGKALQVGLAAATGAAAARLAAGGARIDPRAVADGPGGWTEAFGAEAILGEGAEGAAPEDPAAAPQDSSAAAHTWIKAWPCCLQAHGAIEAALDVRARDGGAPAGEIVVVVHPVSRRAAALDDVTDGLQAKFSIPYLTAFALTRGSPGVADLRTAETEVRALASERIRVRTDPSLLESEARLLVDGTQVAGVRAATGSPENPLAPEALHTKRRELSGTRLDGALDDDERRVQELVETLLGAGG